MKIVILAAALILATFAPAEGAMRKAWKPNRAQCTASAQCRSKCCTKVSARRYVCKKEEEGMTCVGNVRNVPGSGDEWLTNINDARETYQIEYGGEYTPIKWSNDLAINEAQSLANTLASTCTNRLPDENPNDYGIATILNMRNPRMTVNRWVLNGINANTIPSARSNPFTQMIWTTSEYVGCADASSSLSGRFCTASVCYYSYAGNCGWNKFNDWKDAVVAGGKCSRVCPSDVTCSEEVFD